VYQLVEYVKGVVSLSLWRADEVGEFLGDAPEGRFRPQDLDESQATRFQELNLLSTALRIESEQLNRNRVHCSKLASLLVFAIHQAPKREAFVCRDASLTRSGSRRSRELAPGWQTKGADIHCKGLAAELERLRLSWWILIEKSTYQ